MTEKEASIAFSTFPPIGPQRFKLLVQYFGSAQKAWQAPIGKYREIGFSQKLAGSFEKARKEFDLEKYLKRLEKHNVRVVLQEDPEYPKRLATISDAPFLLYIKGEQELENLADVSVAVIGTRKMTTYGADVTEKLVAGLVAAGVTIISGLALGIDGMAHKIALESGGKTIGVLGNGLDTVYPSSHTGLARAMVDHGGLVISEFPLGYPAMPFNFPVRNRIVSGLSLGVLVIEGTERSGTLLTCANAASQGRDVFAVPGPITSTTSKAPNLLLKNGAKLVEKVEDILEELDINAKLQMLNAKSVLPSNPDEGKILEALENEAYDVDSLVRILDMPISDALSLLTLMELKGMVKNTGGVYRKS